MGSTPIRTFERASSARASGSMAVNRQPVASAHPDEFFPIITVDASAIVDRCSAKMPLELETPISSEDVVIDPAAEHAEAAAFRQMDPTLAARCSGVHSATAASNAATGTTGCCA